MADDSGAIAATATTSRRTAGFRVGPNLVTFSAVSCAAVSACVAVGSRPLPHRRYPNSDVFAENWDGKAWSIMPLAAGNASDELNAIDCPDIGDCVAVGATRAGVEGMAPVPLIERWNGRSWRATATPVYTRLNGVGPAARHFLPDSVLVLGCRPRPRRLCRSHHFLGLDLRPWDLG